jgi:hypothetical protein
MPKKLSYTVYLEPEQIERLRAISASTRVPFSVLVRDAIDLVLARYAHLIAAVAVAALVLFGAPALAHGNAPLPASEWTEDARLGVARSCVGEAGWHSYQGECAAIASVYARRWRMARERRPGLRYLDVVRAYSAALRPATRRPWVRELPASLERLGARHRRLWQRVLDSVDAWARGEATDPCPTALHYGAPAGIDIARAVRAGWVRAVCRAPTRNVFWTTTPREGK